MKSSPKLKRLTRPPPGEAWLWLPKRLLESPAWRSMSGSDYQVLFRILLEHSAHAGLCNGSLQVTYDDFEKYGVRRRSIRESLLRLITLGLVKRTRAGRRGYGTDKGEPAQYALTWYKTVSDSRNPLQETNEWEWFRTMEAAQHAIELAMTQLKQARRRKTGKPNFPSGENATGASGENATRDEASPRGDTTSKPIFPSGESATPSYTSGAEARSWSDRDRAFVKEQTAAMAIWSLGEIEAGIVELEAELASGSGLYDARSLVALRAAERRVKTRQGRMEAGHHGADTRVSNPAS